MLSDQQIAKFKNILKDTCTYEWKTRVSTLNEIKDALGNMPMSQAKLFTTNVVNQIGDNRSLVMQEACALAREYCSQYGEEVGFDSIAECFTRACLPIVASSTKVLSEASKYTLYHLVQSTSKGYQNCFERICAGCTASGKAAAYRLACVRLVEKCLIAWDVVLEAKKENSKIEKLT